MHQNAKTNEDQGNGNFDRQKMLKKRIEYILHFRRVKKCFKRKNAAECKDTEKKIGKGPRAEFYRKAQ